MNALSVAELYYSYPFVEAKAVADYDFLHQCNAQNTFLTSVAVAAVLARPLLSNSDPAPAISIIIGCN